MKVKVADYSFEGRFTRKFNFKIPKGLTLKDFIDDLFSYILNINNERIQNFLKDFVDKGYFYPEDWIGKTVENKNNIYFIYDLIEYTEDDNMTDFIEDISKKYPPYNPISNHDYDILILISEFLIHSCIELIPPDDYERYKNEFLPPIIVIGDKHMIDYIFEKTKEFNDQMVKFMFEYYCDKMD